jgi:hypothetical protein
VVREGEVGAWIGISARRWSGALTRRASLPPYALDFSWETATRQFSANLRRSRDLRPCLIGFFQH